MAGGKSLFLSLKLLDHVAGLTTYTPPASLFVALSTAVWSTTATGAAMSEVAAGTGYARVTTTNNTTNWPAATGAAVPGTKANGTVITFPTCTGAWGTIQSWYVLDSATLGAGNILFGAPLSVTKTPVSTDVCSFAIGALVWTEQ
jgi:hypothetical protein